MAKGSYVQVTAVGEEIGNGFCVVRHEWLVDALFQLAKQKGVVYNGKCIISSEFIDSCWNAKTVYDWDGNQYSV